MNAGEILSALLLIIGFGLQIAGTIILRCVHDRDDDQECKGLTEVDGIVVLIFGMATLLLFGIASTKEEEFSSFIKRISKPKEQTPPSDEIFDPTDKILIKPKEEIKFSADENTGTTAF